MMISYPNKEPRKSYMSFSLEPLDMDMTKRVLCNIINIEMA